MGVPKIRIERKGVSASDLVKHFVATSSAGMISIVTATIDRDQEISIKISLIAQAFGDATDAKNFEEELVIAALEHSRSIAATHDEN